MSSRPPRYYRPELDAVRFLLFSLVFFAHYKEYTHISTVAHPILYMWQIAVGFVLPVFFLLSSYLIVELLLREREKTGTISINQFYVRRILRIWPLYFSVFYGLALIAHWVPKAGPPDHLSWLAFTFFAGNLYIYKFGWVTYTVAPLWSISVEEQFYLTIPWLAKWRGAWAIGITSVLLILISYVTIWRSFLHLTEKDNMIWVNSLVQFQFFAYGALLAIAFKYWKWTPSFSIPVRLCLYAVAAACWWTAAAPLHWTISFWHPLSLGKALAGWALGALGVILIFVGTLGWPEHLVPKFLVKLGNISFGLYVFHSMALYFCFFTMGKWAERHLGPAALLLQTVSAIGLMFAMSFASYNWLEMPFLKFKKYFTVVSSKVEGAKDNAEPPQDCTQPAPLTFVAAEESVA